MAKVCYGCMKPKHNSPICEHCGYNENLQNYPHQLPIGTILNGRYLIGKVLGQGGFGITYIGRDLLLEATVAIKECYPGRFVARDCSNALSVSSIGEKAEKSFRYNRDRFIAEAKIQVKLKTVPGIVRIQGLFEENNTAYIVMEYVQGINLKDYLQMSGENLTAEETFSLINPVINVLQKVHEAELVHLDISPDNIMIQLDGTVKLLDFGAVHELEEDNSQQEENESTQTILKHGFAPIEQYNESGDIGPWTDIYALCATIYYCLTGTIPNDAAERCLGKDNVDWDQITGLTAAQIIVLKQGMDVSPKKRIGTIEELREGLFEQSAILSATTHSKACEKIANTSGTAMVLEEMDQHRDQENRAETESKTDPNASAKTERTVWLNKKKIIKIAATILVGSTVFGIALSIRNLKEPEEAITVETSELMVETTAFPTETMVMATETSEPISTEPIVEEPAWRNNVLMADTTLMEDNAAFWRDDNVKQYYEIYDYFSKRPIFNTEIPRSKITDVFFLDSVSTAPETVYDVSAGQDGSVLAWTEKNRKGALNLYIAGEGGVNGVEACHALFYGYKELESVNFNNCFFTDTTQNMSNMFTYCKKLKTINLDGLNTSSTTNMSGMFSNCEQLTALDLNGFDTSNVTNMSSMFSSSSKIKSLDISSFDTSNVTDMSYMFAYLTSMTSFDISHFDTAKVTDMSGMFCGCSNEKFTTLDLSNLDTSSVTDMSRMFYGCRWLTGLDLRNFDTSKVTDMQSMFSYCRRITSLNLSSFDTSNVTNMQSMFEMCSMIPSLEISHFDTAKVIDMSHMFYKCGYLKKMDVTQWDVSNVKNTENMFFGCDKLPLDYKKIGGKYIWSS